MSWLWPTVAVIAVVVSYFVGEIRGWRRGWFQALDDFFPEDRQPDTDDV